MTDPQKAPSLDEAEIAKFSAMAAEWWRPDGKFAVLHAFNPVRLAFIRDHALVCLRPVFGHNLRRISFLVFRHA